MIKVYLNTDEFEYDIRSMIKAFYPGEYQYFMIEKSKTEPQKEPEAQQVCFSIGIQMKQDSIELFWSAEDVNPMEKAQKQWKVSTEKESRIHRKNDLKQILYSVLSQMTGKTLPWGTLTGIRPTKLMMKGVLSGESKEAMKHRMEQDYLISHKKFELGYEIACREREIIGKISEGQGYSLYVSVPFCPTTCLYCSFTSYPEGKWRSRMDEYVKAVKKELAFVAEAMKHKELNTVYFGGGTPTTLSASQLEELVTFIYQSFDMSHVQEFTIEAGRPDSITKEKLEAMKRAGVDRISINPQTMKQETLDLIGRRHTVEQTVEAFRMARECGFDNINMDLILGLPGEHPSDVRDTLEQIKKLGPDNLTVHSLARKRNSRLTQEIEKYKEFYFDDTEDSMDLAECYARKMGLAPYYLYRQKNMAGNQENVGYAVPGKEGIYNILIMEERQSILAVGAGGITKLVATPGTLSERVEIVKDVETYLERIDEMIERKNEALQRCGLRV